MQTSGGQQLIAATKTITINNAILDVADIFQSGPFVIISSLDGALVVRVEDGKSSQIEIYNLNGQWVAGSPHAENINTFNLPAKGIYIVRVITEQGIITRKVVY